MSVICSFRPLIHQSVRLVDRKVIAETWFKSTRQQKRIVSGMSAVPRFQRVCLRSDEDITRIKPLLFAYLQNPDLLTSLKDLTLDRVYYDRYDYDRHPNNNSRTTEDVTVTGDSPFKDHVESLSLPRDVSQQLLDHLPSSNLDHTQPKTRREYNVESHAIATLLMTLAPNIETLRLQEPDPQSPVDRFLTRNNHGRGSRLCLQNLKHVHLAPDQASPYTDEREYCRLNLPRMLSYFHRLPSIESITADAIMEDLNDDPLICPHLSNIKSFSFTHSSLSSQILSALIRLPKQNYLENFRYTGGGRSEGSKGRPYVVLRTIGKALETQQSSLRLLDLDLEDEINYPGPRIDPDEGAPEDKEHWESILDYMSKDPNFMKDLQESVSPLHAWELPETKEYGYTIGSLAKFTELKTLRIGVKTLLGAPGGPAPPFSLIDALPPNLTEFTLIGYRRSDNPVIDPLVEEFMSLRQEKFPSLNEVIGIEEFVEAGHCDYNPDEGGALMWPGVTWDGKWELAEV